MGCDIHIFAERRKAADSDWQPVFNHFTLDRFDQEYYKKDKGDKPFDWRSYSMFAFLAGVRNYDRCDPISEPKGLPSDVSQYVRDDYKKWDGDAHSDSYLTLKELIEFDYDKEFWNRRVTKQLSTNSWTGAGLAEEGEGKIISYRENLGEFFFVHLEELKALGEPENVRIVFWFDN
jgi:hypothetical protein